MLIGFDGTNGIFSELTLHKKYDKIDIYHGLLDHLYITNSTAYHDIDKPTNWTFETVLNATFNGTLEGGSIGAGGNTVDKVKIKKRRADELEWQDVVTLDMAMFDEDKFHTFVDWYVRNDYRYQYALVPIASGIEGEMVLSEEVKAEFDGVFVSDKSRNYYMLYNLEISDFSHNSSTTTHELRGARYPIVTFNQTDYQTFSIEADYISNESLDNNERQVAIKFERQGKDDFLRFLQDGKPKVYRDAHGNLMVVAINKAVTERPNPDHAGRARISFDCIEIGQVDDKTLERMGLTQEVGGIDAYR